MKENAFIGYLPQRCEAVNLIAAAVGQDGVRPVHEPVKSTQIGYQMVPRPQIKMIGVAEDDLTAQFCDKLRGQRFNRSPGAHGHEGRGVHIAMRRPHLSESGQAQRVLFNEIKFEIHVKSLNNLSFAGCYSVVVIRFSPLENEHAITVAVKPVAVFNGPPIGALDGILAGEGTNEDI